MKKIWISLLLIVIAFTISVSAVEYDAVYTYQNEDIEIYVIRNGLSDEQIQNIISDLSNSDTSETKPMGLWCTLFGHNMEYTQTQVIEHNYYSTAPHCRSVKYNVGACTRCDHTETEEISVTRLACH